MVPIGPTSTLPPGASPPGQYSLADVTVAVDNGEGNNNYADNDLDKFVASEKPSLKPYVDALKAVGYTGLDLLEDATEDQIK